jgi:hypothetical protein
MSGSLSPFSPYNHAFASFRALFGNRLFLMISDTFINLEGIDPHLTHYSNVFLVTFLPHEASADSTGTGSGSGAHQELSFDLIRSLSFKLCCMGNDLCSLICYCGVCVCVCVCFRRHFEVVYDQQLEVAFAEMVSCACALVCVEW